MKRSDDRYVFVFVKIQGYVQVEFVSYIHIKNVSASKANYLIDHYRKY